jgi:hypothetical protein
MVPRAIKFDELSVWRLMPGWFRVLYGDDTQSPRSPSSLPDKMLALHRKSSEHLTRQIDTKTCITQCFICYVMTDINCLSPPTIS